MRYRGTMWFRNLLRFAVWEYIMVESAKRVRRTIKNRKKTKEVNIFLQRVSIRSTLHIPETKSPGTRNNFLSKRSTARIAGVARVGGGEFAGGSLALVTGKNRELLPPAKHVRTLLPAGVGIHLA